MKHAKTSTVAMMTAAVLLAACGSANDETAATTHAQTAEAAATQPAAPVTSTETASPPAQAAPAASPDRLRSPKVTQLTLAANGVPTERATPPADTIKLAGGCVDGRPMSWGFEKGQPRGGDWFYVAFETAEGVAVNQTGTFAVSKLVWDNGTYTPDGLPEGTDLKLPLRLEGSGTVNVTAHRSDRADRLMAGTVTGTVTSAETGASADLSIDFKIKQACLESLN